MYLASGDISSRLQRLDPEDPRGPKARGIGYLSGSALGRQPHRCPGGPRLALRATQTGAEPILPSGCDELEPLRRAVFPLPGCGYGTDTVLIEGRTDATVLWCPTAMAARAVHEAIVKERTFG